MTTDALRKSRRPHVVVVGGGFGGLSAVRGLRHSDVDITLVDRHPYNIFQPLLYQVATAALNPGDITWFLRAAQGKQKNLSFKRAEVTGVNPELQTVMLDGESPLKYDYLVLALGVTANFFGVSGAREYAIPLYTRGEALDIRDRLFGALESAAKEGHDNDIRIVVVGGGATGVETAGALAELRNLDLPVTYPELDPTKIHITLVEMGGHVLAPFHASLRRYAAAQLRKRGVDLRLETAVEEVGPDWVQLTGSAGEERLHADLVVWASGVTAYERVGSWGVRQGRAGRIEVGDDLRVLGHDRIFAVGDAAVNPEAPLPQLAQPAAQGGIHVAHQIRMDLQGAGKSAFKYKDKGTMATIGRASAIAQISHLPNLRGFPAWIIWVGVHVAELLGNRNRTATMVNLTQKYLGWRSHNLIVGQLQDGKRPRGSDRRNPS